MDKNSDEVVQIPFDLKDWASLPIGMYRPKIDDPEEAIRNTLQRMARILPSIKKSSKILIMTSSDSFLPLQLAAEYGSKIEVLCDSESFKKKLDKLITANELDDKLTTYSSASFDDIPHTQETFDMVWSLDAVTGTADMLSLFRSVARVLIPEGRFIFADYTVGDIYIAEEGEKVLKDLKIKSLTSARALQKVADRADLEQVYLREMPDELETHLDKIAKVIKPNTYHKKLKAAMGDMKLSWGFYQFQKRNV